MYRRLNMSYINYRNNYRWVCSDTSSIQRNILIGSFFQSRPDEIWIGLDSVVMKLRPLIPKGRTRLIYTLCNEDRNAVSRLE